MRINDRYIHLDVRAKDQRQLFETLSAPLVQDGMVKSDYVDGLLKREHDYPTGLPVPGGLAIPHTDASYVINDALSVGILEAPVKFNEMGGEPDSSVDVGVVILLSLSNSDDHLKMLQDIVRAIQKDDIAMKLSHAHTKSEVRESISAFLEQ